MKHSSANVNAYQHVVTYTPDEVADILRIHATQTYRITNQIAATAQLQIPNIERDETLFTLTILST